MTAREIVADRFWARVQKGDGCWLWTASKSRAGYGAIFVDGKTRRATHVAVWLTTGEWPKEGLVVCHHCDVPSCVRPDHLFVGTQMDNMRDCVRKRRNKFGKIPLEAKARGERHGMSKLTAADVQAIRSSPKFHYEVAAEYGVDRTTVSLIRRGKTWKHVTGAA